jgi:hypothetical protein
MSGSWQAIARAVQVSDPAAADLVHRFLSQVLAVEAGAIGERLAALEAGLRRGTPPEPARLVAELGPLIESLQRQTEEAIRPGPDAGP